jgi:predicted HicB family RNase H-like nuclease
MKNYLEYKGYLGTVEFSAEDNCLFGKIIGINDLISYEAQEVSELKEGFEEAVNDYLETCKELGKQPTKTFKGVFNVRTTTSTHRNLVLLAARKNMKLNELASKALTYLVKNEDKVLESL